MTRCLIYTRVSTREQADEGYSIAAQREACLRFIAERGFTLVGEYSDRGESARTAERPEFQTLLAHLQQDRSITALVVHKLDRLARNLEDHVAIRASLRKLGVAFYSVTESLEESASGKLIEGVLATIAEFFSANLAQEIRKGLAQKANEGRWPTRAPLGYRNTRRDAERRGEAIIVPDAERAALITQAFELYALGTWSLPALQAELTRRGLRNHADRPVATAKLTVILRNPLYAGKVVWGGIERDGIHEPLVSPAVFDRVQAILKLQERHDDRSRKHYHYLRGTLACGTCGGRLTSMVAKRRYTYFFCPAELCRQYVRHEAIAEQMEELWQRLELPHATVRRIAETLEAQTLKRIQEHEQTLRHIRRSTAAFDTQRDTAERRLAIARGLASQAGRLLADLGRAYKIASPYLRRRYNQALFHAVYVGDRRILAATFRGPFDRALEHPQAVAITSPPSTGSTEPVGTRRVALTEGRPFDSDALHAIGRETQGSKRVIGDSPSGCGSLHAMRAEFLDGRVYE